MLIRLPGVSNLPHSKYNSLRGVSTGELVLVNCLHLLDDHRLPRFAQACKGEREGYQHANDKRQPASDVAHRRAHREMQSSPSNVHLGFNPTGDIPPGIV